MKPENFKQLALLVIMAVTALIMWAICFSLEKKEIQQVHKTIILGQDTVRVNKYGEVIRE